MSRNFGVAEALQSLVPSALWVLQGEDYEGLEWLDESQEQPSKEDIFAEIERLQEEYDALEYQRLRAFEYPPVTDYLDGIVKDDQDQIDAYIAACQAVKDKYPKPE